MSEIYHLLAPFYDALNAEVDYEAWRGYYEAQFRTYLSSPPTRILDLACGTGSMALSLAKAGYTVTGLDLSPEMLTCAQERTDREGLGDRLMLTMQDMTDFDVGGGYDAVVCTLDGINHLISREAVRRCFTAVRECLREGGLFLFDLNSHYKFEVIYGEEVYTMETDDAYCIWQNDYHPKTGTCDFYIDLFTRRQDGAYIRHQDVQREKYYSLTTVKRLLGACGFSLESVHGGIDGHAVTETDDRWYLTARAI